METLAPARRRALRAKAHHLHPVVSIGQHGLTPAVLHELDVNLLAHELIKVRVFSDQRDERDAMLQRICAALDATPVQHIGKLLILWREGPEKPPVTVPRPKEAPHTGGVRRAREPAPGEPRGKRRARSASCPQGDGQVHSTSPPAAHADRAHDRTPTCRRRRAAAGSEASGRALTPPPRQRLNLFNLRRYAWVPSRFSPSS